MTKQQVIDILEAYRPNGIYSGIYQMFQKNFNEKYINLLIDEIIERVKREPDDWIKCSEKMPEPMQQILFYDKRFKDYTVGIYNKNYSALQIGGALIDCKEFTHWMPLPKLPKIE